MWYMVEDEHIFNFLFKPPLFTLMAGSRGQGCMRAWASLGPTRDSWQRESAELRKKTLGDEKHHHTHTADTQYNKYRSTP